MLGLFISEVYAQEATAQAANGFSQFIPLIAIFFIFYFLMIRPQKKKMDEEQKFLDSIKKGDEVFTKSGLLGKVHGLTDKIVTLELEEGVKIKYLRSQIGGLSKDLLENKKEA